MSCRARLERGGELDRVGPHLWIAESGHARQHRGVERSTGVAGLRVESAEIRPRLQVSPDEADLPVAAPADRAEPVVQRQLSQLYIAGVLDIVRVRSQCI